jgi:hypothetical protein
MQQKQKEIYRCLSAQRLGKYHFYGVQPLDLYKWNIALSEALYPLLHTIEIAIRNRLHVEIGPLLKDQSWLLNRNKEILERLNEYWQQKIDLHIRNLRKIGKLDEGHLIAELSFGFWTALLSGPFEYRKLLWPQLKKTVFPNAHGFTIDKIRKRFDQVRSLRNRIFHYGSIWHWRNLSEHHDELIEAIKWINPALLELIEIDRFKLVYKQSPIKIFNELTEELTIAN